MIGAIGLAKATDTIGPKRMISLALFLWLMVAVSAFFVYEKSTFFAIAVVAGFGLGVIQAASRSLMTTLIPAGKEAEMFGFYAFCGKSSSVLGPFVFGVIAETSGGNERLAILSIAMWFLVGLALLQRVNPPARRTA